MDNKQKIAITKDGPYIVSGNIPLDKEFIETGKDGIPTHWGMGQKFPLKETYSLCRCGKSKNMPFCDGAHVKAGFKGTETAGHKTFAEMNDPTIGPDLIMDDAASFCAAALFCHRGDAWTMAEKSDDASSKKIAIEDAFLCPSGRIVAKEKNGTVLEPNLEKSISIVEDTAHMVSGPLWVKGGIQVIGSDGQPYEIRNRVTLCRCGKSMNKPFCDGTHCGINFNDGDERINEKTDK
jgi:CDGSH-type Zn-finger protein